MKTKDRHEEMFKNHDFTGTTTRPFDPDEYYGQKKKHWIDYGNGPVEEEMTDAQLTQLTMSVGIPNYKPDWVKDVETPTGSDGMSPQEVKEFMKVKGEYASPENEGLDVFGVALTVLGILLIIGIVFLRLL